MMVLSPERSFSDAAFKGGIFQWHPRSSNLLPDKAVHLSFVSNSVFYFIEPALFDLSIELCEAHFDDVMGDLAV